LPAPSAHIIIQHLYNATVICNHVMCAYLRSGQRKSFNGLLYNNARYGVLHKKFGSQIKIYRTYPFRKVNSIIQVC
jgi:hypothetical protein